MYSLCETENVTEVEHCYGEHGFSIETSGKNTHQLVIFT